MSHASWTTHLALKGWTKNQVLLHHFFLGHNLVRDSCFKGLTQMGYVNRV